MHDMRKIGLSEERRTTQREPRVRNKARARGGVIVTRGGKRERERETKRKAKKRGSGRRRDRERQEH